MIFKNKKIPFLLAFLGLFPLTTALTSCHNNSVTTRLDYKENNENSVGQETKEIVDDIDEIIGITNDNEVSVKNRVIFKNQNEFLINDNISNLNNIDEKYLMNKVVQKKNEIFSIWNLDSKFVLKNKIEIKQIRKDTYNDSISFILKVDDVNNGSYIEKKITFKFLNRIFNNSSNNNSSNKDFDLTRIQLKDNEFKLKNFQNISTKDLDVINHSKLKDIILDNKDLFFDYYYDLDYLKKHFEIISINNNIESNNKNGLIDIQVKFSNESNDYIVKEITLTGFKDFKKYGNVPLPEKDDKDITLKDLYEMFSHIVKSQKLEYYDFGERKIDSNLVANAYSEWILNEWSKHPYWLLNNDSITFEVKDENGVIVPRVQNSEDEIYKKTWYVSNIKSAKRFWSKLFVENEFRQDFINTLNDISSLIKPNMTEWDKFLAIYNFVLGHFVYIESYNNFEWKIFDGYGLCADYSSFFSLLLNIFGVKSLPMVTNTHEVTWVYLPNPNRKNGGPEYLWYVSDITNGDVGNTKQKNGITSRLMYTSGFSSHQSSYNETSYVIRNTADNSLFETSFLRNMNLYYWLPWREPYLNYFGNKDQNRKQASFTKITGSEPSTFINHRKDTSSYKYSSTFFDDGEWRSIKIENGGTINFVSQKTNGDIIGNSKFKDSLNLTYDEINTIYKNEAHMILWDSTYVFMGQDDKDIKFIFTNPKTKQKYTKVISKKELEKTFNDINVSNITLRNFKIYGNDLYYTVDYWCGYGDIKTVRDIKVEKDENIKSVLKRDLNYQDVLNKINVSNSIVGMYSTNAEDDYSVLESDKQEAWEKLKDISNKIDKNKNNEELNILVQKIEETLNNLEVKSKTKSSDLFLNKIHDKKFYKNVDAFNKYGFNLNEFEVVSNINDLINSNLNARYDLFIKEEDGSWKQVFKNHSIYNSKITSEHMNGKTKNTFKLKIYLPKLEKYITTDEFELIIDNGNHPVTNESLKLNDPMYNFLETNYVYKKYRGDWYLVPIKIYPKFSDFLDFNLYAFSYELHYINLDTKNDVIIEKNSINRSNQNIVFNLGIPSKDNHGIYYTKLISKNKNTSEVNESYSRIFTLLTHEDSINFDASIWKSLIEK